MILSELKKIDGFVPILELSVIKGLVVIVSVTGDGLEHIDLF